MIHLSSFSCFECIQDSQGKIMLPSSRTLSLMYAIFYYVDPLLILYLSPKITPPPPTTKTIAVHRNPMPSTITGTQVRTS
ncbi:hypothetical protein Hanom_Chr05g00400391 [Helianthus anomalus]